MKVQPGKTNKLTIGKLARAAGMSISTVRYYQQRGLLNRPEKSSMGGYRFYGPDDVVRLGLIKRAQALQFTLAEILELVAGLNGHDCHAVKRLAEQKLSSIDAQLRQLEESRKTLKGFIDHCPGTETDTCPLAQALSDDDTPLRSVS